MTEHPVEQAIRKSHCSHKDRNEPQHQCIGTCLITPKGLILDCKACGGDAQTIVPRETLPETRLVRAVLDTLGISYDVIDPEYKVRAAEVVKRWMTGRTAQPSTEHGSLPFLADRHRYSLRCLRDFARPHLVTAALDHQNRCDPGLSWLDDLLDGAGSAHNLTSRGSE